MVSEKHTFWRKGSVFFLQPPPLLPTRLSWRHKIDLTCFWKTPLRCSDTFAKDCAPVCNEVGWQGTCICIKVAPYTFHQGAPIVLPRVQLMMKSIRCSYTFAKEGCTSCAMKWVDRAPSVISSTKCKLDPKTWNIEEFSDFHSKIFCKSFTAELNKKLQSLGRCGSRLSFGSLSFKPKKFEPNWPPN